MPGPLEALTALLGGTSQGAGQGYAEGVGAAIKQRQLEQLTAHQTAQEQYQNAHLAEQARQFDESKMIDASNPELAKILGISPGKIPTQAFPSLMVAGEKERARGEATQRAQAAGKAYEDSAALFPEPGQRTGGLDLQENPEAAGTTPPQQPNRILMTLSKLQAAQAGKEEMGPLTQLLKGMSPNGGKAGPASRLVKDVDGNYVEVPVHTGLAGPQSTGIQGQNPSSARERAVAKYQADPTEANWQNLIVQTGLTSVQPGGAVVSPVPLSGMQPPSQQPNQPAGPQKPQLTAQNPVAFQQPAQPSNDALQDIADANVVVDQLKGMVQTLKGGTLDNVLGGVFKNPQGTLTRGKETYLGYGMTPEQREAIATINTQMQNVKRRLIGATRTVPEMKDIQGAVADEKSFFRGDTAEQMIPKLEAMIKNAEVGIAMRSHGMETTNIRVPTPPPSSRRGTPAKNNDPMGIR